MPEIEVKIINERGLHARASTKLAVLARTFGDGTSIEIRKDDTTVPANSIMGMLLLGASCGQTITLIANGTEAERALTEIKALIDNKFDEGV
jgi:phosphotransferase system HPr (HPr) family protein